MIIHGRISKSKKRKTPKAVAEQNEQWLKSLGSLTTNFSRSVKRVPVKPFVFTQTAFRRETAHIPSKNSDNMAPCVKPADKVYTGTKIVGIGTLHKSNAVPVFSNEEAIDIAKMRRG